MKLSIITVNLNNAKGLHRTIESVISQTSNAFEYIVIDGGSSDESVDIIKSFTSIEPGKHARRSDSTNIESRALSSEYNNQIFTQQATQNPLVFWISEPDTGIYQAMNKGIRVAKGEYCQFLNSGDWLAAPEVIAKMLENLANYSFLYGNVIKQFSDGRSHRDDCAKGYISMLTLYTGSLNHSPVLIKRSLFYKYGFYDEKLRIVSDWKWFVLTIGLHNEPVKYIDLDVVCFDMNGVSNTNTTLLNKERRQVLEELIPSNILADYDTFFKDIDSLKRINRSKTVKKLFWFFDRLLFKFGI